MYQYMITCWKTASTRDAAEEAWNACWAAYYGMLTQQSRVSRLFPPNMKFTNFSLHCLGLEIYLVVVSYHEFKQWGNIQKEEALWGSIPDIHGRSQRSRWRNTLRSHPKRRKEGETEQAVVRGSPPASGLKGGPVLPLALWVGKRQEGSFLFRGRSFPFFLF